MFTTYYLPATAERPRAFFVQFTVAEAALVFPDFAPGFDLAGRLRRVRAKLADPDDRVMSLGRNAEYPLSVVVAEDLSMFDPEPPLHFPYANLWNGHSPFRSIKPLAFPRLADLRTLCIAEITAG